MIKSYDINQANDLLSKTYSSLTMLLVRNHNLDEMKTIATAFQSRHRDHTKIASLRVEVDIEVEQYIETFMSEISGAKICIR